MGTPQFGVLTCPYPYRYGESPYRYGDCPFFAFFSHAQDRPFLAKQTTTQQTLLQRSPFLMRGMRQGAPRSSRRALTPRRVGAHPARVSARLRLKAWVRTRWQAGRAGADWATCLRLLERATATAAAAVDVDVARDGAASTAALSTRVGGVSLRSGLRTERDKKIEQKHVFAMAA